MGQTARETLKGQETWFAGYLADTAIGPKAIALPSIPGQSHTPLLLMDESISWYTKRVQTRFQSPGHSVDGSPNRFLTGFAYQLRVWNPQA